MLSLGNQCRKPCWTLSCSVLSTTSLASSRHPSWRTAMPASKYSRTCRDIFEISPLTLLDHHLQSFQDQQQAAPATRSRCQSTSGSIRRRQAQGRISSHAALRERMIYFYHRPRASGLEPLATSANSHRQVSTDFRPRTQCTVTTLQYLGRITLTMLQGSEMSPYQQRLLSNLDRIGKRSPQAIHKMTRIGEHRVAGVEVEHQWRARGFGGSGSNLRESIT